MFYEPRNLFYVINYLEALMEPAAAATLTFVMTVISTSAAAVSATSDAVQLYKGSGGSWMTLRKKITKPFLRGKRIAFLGASGVGKSVLLDYLSGKGYKRGYAPNTELSEDIETEALPNTDRKTTIVVIPGQSSRQRIKSLNELRSKPVDGIVYVVSNGFATVRNTNVINAIRSTCSDVDSYRQYKLREELEDLKIVSQLMSDSWVAHKKPTWMLVVPTKLDLYAHPDKVNELFSYYAPGGNSQFVQTVESIRSKGGGIDFSWDISPVFTWQEHFSWNGQVVTSTLNQVVRDSLLVHLESKLEKYCKL